MKRFGSSRPTACPEDGGMGSRASNDAAVPGPRPMARGRVGASLDYGAASIAALQASNRKH
ncbi:MULTISPECIES: hypothetical protein [Lysobacter]|uniref:hypothetical protein n=1 Tax=Lysobacter TaxID=68 RepID=UPI001269D972|nr:MULTISPECIES: hypothetical protein [Lysobacter]